MQRIEKDEEREYRITMEAVVDAYDRWERALGWYYYYAIMSILVSDHSREFIHGQICRY